MKYRVGWKFKSQTTDEWRTEIFLDEPERSLSHWGSWEEIIKRLKGYESLFSIGQFAVVDQNDNYFPVELLGL